MTLSKNEISQRQWQLAGEIFAIIEDAVSRNLRNVPNLPNHFGIIQHRPSHLFQVVKQFSGVAGKVWNKNPKFIEKMAQFNPALISTRSNGTFEICYTQYQAKIQAGQKGGQSTSDAKKQPAAPTA